MPAGAFHRRQDRPHGVAAAADDIPPVWFRPKDAELVDICLAPKLAGRAPAALSVPFVHDADVYSAAPDQLVAGRRASPGIATGVDLVWYFYTAVRHCSGRRRARAIAGGADGGWWHSEGGLRRLTGSAAPAFFQKFSYKYRTASGAVVKPGWLMVEFSVDGGDTVLCKVYRSPRSSSTPAESTAEALESPCTKRKAAAVDEHPRRTTSEKEDQGESVEGDLAFEAAPPPGPKRLLVSVVKQIYVQSI